MSSRSTTDVKPVDRAEQAESVHSASASMASARKAVQVALDRRDNGGDPRAAADDE